MATKTSPKKKSGTAKPPAAAKPAAIKNIAGLRVDPNGDLLLMFTVTLAMKDGSGVIKFGGGGSAEGAVMGGGPNGELTISVPVSAI